MLTVEQMARDIVAREGGYVNDPADPGGATNHGVTLGTLRQLGMDLDGDGQVTAADVRALTADQAVQIFMQDYYRGPQIDKLPDPIQPNVFDMQVNAGGNAIKILQRLLKRMGFDCGAVDGALGPNTEAKAASAQAAAPDYLNDAYAIARRNYYLGIADANPSLRKFARTPDGGKGGWIIRAESFMEQRYRLTDQQFQERTQAWA